MTRYRRTRIISTTIGLVIVGATIGVIQFGFMDAVIGAVVGGVVLLGVLVLLPSHRKVALAALDAGRCPQCDGPIKRDAGERLEWYCRACRLGFTARGRRVAADDE